MITTKHKFFFKVVYRRIGDTIYSSSVHYAMDASTRSQHRILYDSNLHVTADLPSWFETAIVLAGTWGCTLGRWPGIGPSYGNISPPARWSSSSRSRHHMSTLHKISERFWSSHLQISGWLYQLLSLFCWCHSLGGLANLQPSVAPENLLEDLFIHIGLYKIHQKSRK